MPLETPRALVRKTPTKLAALTAAVLLAHVGLLYGTPMSVATPAYLSEAAFTTRMIAPVPVSQPQAQPVLHSTTPTILAPVRPRKIALAQPGPTPDSATAFAGGEEANAAQEASNPIPPVESAPALPPDNAYGPVSQLLSAGGPPANLKPGMDTTLYAAVDDSKPTAGASAGAGGAQPKQAANGAMPNFVFPPTTRLKYKINGEVKGFAYYVNGDLQWRQDGKTYDARMEVSHFLLGSRVQTSRGDLGATGLEPIRFGDKVRSEVAAHFDRTKAKVTFSANTPDAVLVTGMQDHLSALVQLGSMLGGAPGNFPEGTLVPLEAVGPRSVESWVFKVGPQEKLTLPGGQVSAIKLVREAVGDYGTRGEVWLAPAMGYLPVRIRLIEPNGNFVDQKWSDTVAP